MARKILSMRIWILIIALFLSIVAINPNPWASGVQIKTVEQGSLEAEQGMKSGETLKSINDQQINTLYDFANIMKGLEKEPVEVSIKTDKGTFTYEAIDDIGFETDDNLTIISVEDFATVEKEAKIEAVNDETVTDTEALRAEINKIMPLEKITITTNKNTYTYLSRGTPKITAVNAQKTNIQKGLDLQGGTRVLIRPVSDNEITDKDVADLIKVLSNRLNVYGLADLTVRSAKDWEGNKFVLIEIAGVTSEEVKELIGKQGKFEAKIAGNTVFEGGKQDITFVCRDDGSCSGIRECNPSSENQWYCKFEFVIHLSPEAAKRHADITKDLDLSTSTDGREIINETIDFYLDGKMVDSLQIGADLKGKEATAIAISGPGIGASKMIAVEKAVNSMDKLQTILITGSLPFEIKLEKVDTISPILGKSFIQNALLVGLIALIVVTLVIFIRYRSIKITIPVMITAVSELLITLGFGAFIQWNFDIASIAGLIATIGTGVNDQIVMIDEIITKKSSEFFNWKQKIKRAFFIIMTAYFTMAVAMIPLWNVGAGLVRGFAVTTIVGITAGVLITRPAFASIAEKLVKTE